MFGCTFLKNAIAKVAGGNNHQLYKEAAQQLIAIKWVGVANTQRVDVEKPNRHSYSHFLRDKQSGQ